MLAGACKIVSEGFVFQAGIDQGADPQGVLIKRAYLRGAFLAGGSVNNPEGSSYHLEIASMYEEHCKALCELANRYRAECPLHRAEERFRPLS